MKIMVILVLAFCLVSCIAFISVSWRPSSAARGGEYEVYVINGFTNNSSLPLVVWCASQDGDFGGRALQEGDDFSWSLKTNFWRATTAVYSCTVKWDRIRKRFDAFNGGRDSSRCAVSGKCFWLVREDGFYFSSEGVNWEKDFSWS
ncbi:hypothetical protein U1Q18_030824 [Sarracenia purpurea var. burkii]